MPRCVRNFWLSARIDGRRSSFASGPRSKEGGFHLDIYQRDGGEVSTRPLRITGVCRDGKLAVSVHDGGTELARRETVR